MIQMNENELRSTMALLGVPTMPVPPDDVLRPRDFAHATMEAFGVLRQADELARGSSRLASTCLSWASGREAACFRSPGHPIPGASCIYCTAAGQSQQTPCAFVPGINNDVLIAAGLGDGPSLDPARYWRPDPIRPNLKMSYRGGSTDADGSTEPFFAGDQWRYYLASPLMLYDPCDPTQGKIDGLNPNYCGSSFDDAAIWVCRRYTKNEHGDTAFRLYCNTPTQVDEGVPTPSQHTQDREFRLAMKFNLFRPPVLARWRLGHGTAFWLRDKYCFNVGCVEDDPRDTWWNCIDANSNREARVGTINSLKDIYMIADPSFSTTQIADGQRYPHRRTDDIAIKNLVWGQVADQFARNFENRFPGLTHSSNHFHSQSESLWVVDGVNFAGLPVVINPSATHPTEFEMVMHEPTLGLDLRGGLEIESLSGSVSLSVESRKVSADADLPSHSRVIGSVALRVTLRVRRSAASHQAGLDAGLIWRTSIEVEPGIQQDPFNWEVANPDQLDSEHPHLKFLATGPDGGHVPYTMEWSGLLAQEPFSIGIHEYRPPPCDFKTPSACCSTMHEINRTIIFAEPNDHGSTDIEDQLQQGSVGFRVPGLGEFDEDDRVYGCECD